MTITHIPEEEENIVDLKLLQGGKQPPRIGHNWLKDLGDEAIFIIGSKNSGIGESWLGLECHLYCQQENAAFLIIVRWDDGVKKETRQWVVIDEFCKKWECIAILDAGTSNRTNQPPRLVEHENNNGEERDVSMDEESGLQRI